MFTAYPTYSRYRTLQLTNPLLRGEDVYALQTALNGLAFAAGETDGIFGSKTESAVRAAQQKYPGLVVDGKAGQKTQTALAMRYAGSFRSQYGLPTGLPDGQLLHESGCFLGNYSPLRSDGSYDAGVAQRNTAHTPAMDGFTVPLSVGALAKNTRDYFDKYTKVTDTRRRWELAVGAWNAPAYANYLAGKVSPYAVPSDSARKTLEAYIASCCAYLVV